jgi:glutathione synthase/RimK-type ligase-like ATP-grasp enzyme
MMDFICYKTILFSSLNEFRKYYPSQFSIYPRSFILPQEFLEFQREYMTLSSHLSVPPSWVIKPKNSCCGNGIIIAQSITEVSHITESSVAQLYIQSYLIDQKKFDFRLYVLIGCLS